MIKKKMQFKSRSQDESFLVKVFVQILMLCKARKRCNQDRQIPPNFS